MCSTQQTEELALLKVVGKLILEGKTLGPFYCMELQKWVVANTPKPLAVGNKVKFNTTDVSGSHYRIMAIDGEKAWVKSCAQSGNSDGYITNLSKLECV